MKKIKRLGLKAVNLMLCICIAFGAAGISAFGASVAPTNVESFFGSSTVDIPELAYYGDIISVPEGASKVVAPNGTVVTPSAVSNGKQTFKASLLGFYEVTYTTTSTSYTYRINVIIKDNWQIEVKDNGADIPTFAQVSSTEEVTIPAALAVVYDVDKPEEVVRTNTDADVNVPVLVTVTAPDSTKLLDKVDITTSEGVLLTMQGQYFVRYEFALPSGDATVKNHVITQDYAIRVQQRFEDTEGPTLQVSNPNSTANINVAYVLPKATATDNFDENVKITVRVTGPDEQPVRVAVVDEEYDYAIAQADPVTSVVFDNNKTMKFYPMEQGTYKITYSAEDDKGNPSATIPYYVEVEDNLAPVIKVEESQIPVSWGAQVFMQHSTTPTNVNGQAIPTSRLPIVFPYPEVRDNNQKRVEGVLQPVDSIEFTIKDESGKEIIRFSNLTTEAGRKATVEGKEFTFDVNDGLKFDFASDFTVESGASKTGVYTVSYTARDANRRSASKEFTINYKDKHTDILAPGAEILNYPSYFVWDETEYSTFIVPTPDISDDLSMPRVYSQITMIVDGTFANGVHTAGTGKEYIVEAGDVLRFKTNGVELMEVGATSKAFVNLSTASKIVLKVFARDNVGNETTWYSDEITMASRDITNTFTINALLDDTQRPAVQGDVVEVAESITIGYQNAADFVGFEVRITEPAEAGALSTAVVASTEMTVKFDEANKRTIISDVSFVPSKIGKYMVTVRAFDFGGNQKIIAYPITVAASGLMPVSASVPTTIEQGVAITLPRETVPVQTDPVGEVVCDIKINGPHFSLRGYELTALATGDYNMQFIATHNTQTVLKREYNVSVKNTQAPTLEIVNTLPAYTNLNEAVVLPEAIAIDVNGIFMQADVGGTMRPYTVEVKDKNGDLVRQEVDSEGNLTFTPTVDGKYTITYKAFNLSQRPLDTDVILYMYAGDITPPDFELQTSTPSTFRVNDSFFFSKLTLLSEPDKADLSNVSYRKILIFPDNTEVRVEGAGETFRERQNDPSESDGYKLTQTGVYKVVYEVTDKAGNTSRQEYSFSVASKPLSPTLPITAISTVLIVLGVLMLLGVAVYIWRFKPIKESKK